MLSIISSDPVQDILLALGTIIAAIQLRNGQRINDTKSAVIETKKLADTAVDNATAAALTAKVAADRVEDVHVALANGLKDDLVEAVADAASTAVQTATTPPVDGHPS